jgi:DNA-binding MurR/RpiR family transcriptional regulator
MSSPPKSRLAPVVPPQTLGELRLLAGKIRSGSSADLVLGDRAGAAFAAMLKSPPRTAVQTISEIAEESGVDPATLSRLGQRLGYDGFAGLHDVFRRHVADNARFYSDRMEKLIDRTVRQPPQNRMQQLAANESESIRATLKQVEDDLAHAAGLVADARRVVVLGLRATYAVSFFLGSYLMLLRDGVTIAGGPGHLLDGDLAQMSHDDLLIAATFRPYTRLTVAACNASQRAGVPILVLTDRGSPLLAKKRKWTSLAIDGEFHFDRALAPFFMAELLLVAVAEKLGRAGLAVTKQRQPVADFLEIELK